MAVGLVTCTMKWQKIIILHWVFSLEILYPLLCVNPLISPNYSWPKLTQFLHLKGVKVWEFTLKYWKRRVECLCFFLLWPPTKTCYCDVTMHAQYVCPSFFILGLIARFPINCNIIEFIINKVLDVKPLVPYLSKIMPIV